MCSKTLFHFEIASVFNDFDSHFAILATASVADKSNSVLARSVRSNPDCLHFLIFSIRQ